MTLKERFQHWLAGVFVYKKIRHYFGGRARLFISGGAPMPYGLLRFFRAVGILILEGYGMTETSPVLSVNSPNDFVLGSMGKPIEGIEIRIGNDGEIEAKGDSIMKEYFKEPKLTAAAFRDGWFKTGDIGYLDEQGFLYITDRKKEMIVTTAGKNISPQKIEGRILEDSLFRQAVVIGDGRPFLCALLVLDFEEVLRYAERLGIANKAYDEILKDQKIKNWVRSRLDICTANLASYETIKGFILLAREIGTNDGEMTPVLKVKRRLILKAHETVIDELYDELESSWHE